MSNNSGGSEQRHIRPTIRRRGRPKEENDLDAMVEQTRERMSRLLSTTTTATSSSTPPSSVVDDDDALLSLENSNKKEASCVDAVAYREAMSKLEIDPERKRQPKSILRPPKYSGEAKMKGASDPSVTTLEEPSLPAKKSSPITLKKKRSSAAVKDMVVERHNPVPTPVGSLSGSSSSIVEGYDPRVTGKSTTKVASAMRETAKAQAEEGVEQPPVVLKNMEELLNYASSELQTQQGKAPPPQTVEADVEFACMTPEEYEETLAMAETVEQQDRRREEENPAADDNDTPSRRRVEDVFRGHQNVFSSSDDDDNNSGTSDDDEDSSLIGMMMFQDDEDMLEEELPAPEPRAFLRLWNALLEWITPEAVALVQSWQISGNPLDWQEVGDLNYDRLHPQVDRSDVGASRCAGLMAMLKMHLNKCLAERNYATGDRRRVEAKLADLVRTFDYSRPVARLDTRMWRVMALVLVDTVLQQQQQQQQQESEVDGAHLVECIQSVGITEEEYRYLTKSAFTSLAKDS